MGKSSRRIARVGLLGFISTVGSIFALPGTIKAQDRFEICVEQFEKPVLGTFSLEEHVNYVGIGSSRAEGTVAPTDHQLHMSSELTAGLTTHVSVGTMVMTAALPGAHGGWQYAGWRVLPHFYAPESWGLPLRLGLTAEFSFQDNAFDESTATLEFRPILEKNFGRVQLDANPAFEHSISRIGPLGKWNFQPAVRVGYEINSRVSLSLEYYGSYGSLAHLFPRAEQVHRIYPGTDIQLRDNLLLNVGIGAGMGPAGDRLIYKTRIEYLFGKASR